MVTYKRICLIDYDLDEHNFALYRGKEYITSSRMKDGYVIVFTPVWARAPEDIFAGAVCFTGSNERSSDMLMKPNPINLDECTSPQGGVFIGVSHVSITLEGLSVQVARLEETVNNLIKFLDLEFVEEKVNKEPARFVKKSVKE